MGKNINYQFTVFGDFADISPNDPNVIIDLLKLYKENNYDFMPTTFKEIAINTETVNRIALLNEDGWKTSIGFNRIDVHMDYKKEKKYNEMNIDKISEEAIILIDIILNKFNKKVNRIALNTIEILDKTESDCINAKYSEKGSIISFYENNKPYEWYERLVSKVTCDKLNNEEINVITDLSNFTGEISNGVDFEKVDGIILKFDINTLPNNSTHRFTSNDIKEFFADAKKYKSEIENNMKGK